MDLGFEFVLLVGKEHDSDVRVARAAQILRRQLLRAENLQHQTWILEIVVQVDEQAGWGGGEKDDGDFNWKVEK